MKTIGEILNKNTGFTKLIKKTKNIKHLEHIFHNILDPNLAKHCNIATLQDSELSVTVTNASWATKLRYIIPDIIKNLKVQPEFKNLAKIHYHIAHTVKNKKLQLTKKERKLSDDNEILWQATLVKLKKKKEYKK